MNELRAKLGFKGERGYSAYEVAVQNGYEGTEQDWLATLGTSSHLNQEKAKYTSTEGQTEFNLPSNYTSDTFVDVYVDGVRLTSDEYTISNNKVILGTGLEADKTVELIEMTMSTNSLPIVTTIDENSTDDTTPSTKTIYDNILSPLDITIRNFNQLDNNVEQLTNSVGSLTDDIDNIETVIDENYAEQQKTKTELENMIKISEMGYVATRDMTPIGNIGGSTGRIYELTFDKEYKTPPMVIISSYHNTSISEYGLVSIAVNNITTTGCKLLFGANIGLANYGINYIVISND